MAQLPFYIGFIFGATTLVTAFLCYWVVMHSRLKQAERLSKLVLFITVLWLVIQAYLSLDGLYYQHLEALPPRLFLIGIGPMVLLMIISFTTKKGRNFIDALPLDKLGWLHTVRIPVELVLYMLFVGGVIPQIMTFDGWNFDILAGLSAPLMMYFVFVKKLWKRKILLFWNILGLGLVLFIICIAILSAPFPLQQLAFEQPNTAVLYYPFSWLPTFVAPMVVFAHLISIRQLLNAKEN